jgi:glycosyltransferase involved in cell wall biosynthesis
MEGFGLPVVESLSFGVPVLTSDIGSTAELLKLPGTIGFIPTDPKDLATKLKLFLTNQSTQQTLTEGAKSAKNLLGNWSDYANDLYLFATKE